MKLGAQFIRRLDAVHLAVVLDFIALVDTFSVTAAEELTRAAVSFASRDAPTSPAVQTSSGTADEPRCCERFRAQLNSASRRHHESHAVAYDGVIANSHDAIIHLLEALEALETASSSAHTLVASLSESIDVRDRLLINLSDTVRMWTNVSLGLMMTTRLNRDFLVQKVLPDFHVEDARQRFSQQVIARLPTTEDIQENAGSLTVAEENAFLEPICSFSERLLSDYNAKNTQAVQHVLTSMLDLAKISENLARAVGENGVIGKSMSLIHKDSSVAHENRRLADCLFEVLHGKIKKTIEIETIIRAITEAVQYQDRIEQAICHIAQINEHWLNTRQAAGHAVSEDQLLADYGNAIYHCATMEEERDIIARLFRGLELDTGAGQTEETVFFL